MPEPPDLVWDGLSDDEYWELFEAEGRRIQGESRVERICGFYQSVRSRTAADQLRAVRLTRRDFRNCEVCRGEKTRVLTSAMADGPVWRVVLPMGETKGFIRKLGLENVQRDPLPDGETVLIWYQDLNNVFGENKPRELARLEHVTGPDALDWWADMVRDTPPDGRYTGRLGKPARGEEAEPEEPGEMAEVELRYYTWSPTETTNSETIGLANKRAVEALAPDILAMTLANADDLQALSDLLGDGFEREAARQRFEFSVTRRIAACSSIGNSAWQQSLRLKAPSIGREVVVGDYGGSRPAPF